MKRTLFTVAVFTTLAGTAHAEPPPHSGRTWTYGNFTAAFSPKVSGTVLSGYRMEYARTDGADPRRLYLFELFTGPNFSQKLGSHVTLKGSLWYYYVGFPMLANSVREKGTYEHTHSIELIPSIEYKTGKWSFYNRVILHNTIYASVYGSPEQRNGWGLVMREMVQAKYAATPSLSLVLADEPFFGLKEDGDVVPNRPVNNGPGYWEDGLRLNRLYAGLDIKLTKSAAITPLYMFESTFKDGKAREHGHYAFVTFSYVLKLFQAAPTPPPPPPPPPSSPG